MDTVNDTFTANLSDANTVAYSI